jgi:hypothetical protein
VEYRYKADVLEQLTIHGIRPTSATPPQKAHDFVSDLYRYELRRLRARLLRKEIEKTSYYGHVVAVRERYRLLALKPWEWLDRGD